MLIRVLAFDKVKENYDKGKSPIIPQSRDITEQTEDPAYRELQNILGKAAHQVGAESGEVDQEGTEK